MNAKGRVMQGVVTSNKMQNTIVVKVERWVKHPVYGKILKKFTKVKAHDESNGCNEGDTVVIKECRPISKQKAWTLVNIVKKAR